MLIRDRLGEWLGDEDFAAAFGIRGRPGWSPSRLALVTVLQRAENLADRQAAEAVRTRIDWQYLLGLPLDDPGFDHTVLAEFRGRVARAGLEQVTLDALLARLAAEGLVKAGGKQRTDSTHVVAAVAALTRLQLAGESVRAAPGTVVVVFDQVWPFEQRVVVAAAGLGPWPQQTGDAPQTTAIPSLGALVVGLAVGLQLPHEVPGVRGPAGKDGDDQADLVHGLLPSPPVP